MNKLYAFTLGLLTAVVGTAGAQVLPEGFETLDLAAGDWTATQAEGAAAARKWEIVNYSAETAQFPKNIPTITSGGEKVLKCTVSGAFGGNGTAPDNKLFSPEITVGENTWLSFLMANNFAGNAAANITEPTKARYSVVVSPTGDKAEASFTDVVYADAPVGLNVWKPMSIDLSAYKGKTIRIMFRCYLEEMSKISILNTLYIDNISLVSAANTDVKLSKLEGLFNGTVKTQQVSVDVSNNGFTNISSFTLNTKVNDVLQKSETLTQALAPGESYVYKTAVNLVEGDNTVTVDVLASGDCLSENNTASASNKVAGSVELPFTMASDGTESSQLISTLSGSVTRPAGWRYMTNYKKWVHTVDSRGRKAYLYTATPYHLEKGTLKVEVKGTPTNPSAKFEIYLTNRTDQFGECLASVTLTPENNDRMALVDVAATGDYYLAFSVTDTGTGQIPLDALKVTKAEELPDIAVLSVTSPLHALAGAPAPVTVSLRNEGVGEASDVEVSYTVNKTTVRETVSSVPGGGSISYTFTTPVNLTAGTYSMEVAAHANGDSNGANNSAKVIFRAYDAHQLPYVDSFENESECALWTISNVNGDSNVWAVNDGYQFDGTHIAALPQSTVDHDDWLISPAIALPDGFDGKLAFYYGAGGNVGMAHIKAYLMTGPDPATLPEDAEPILDLNCDGVNVNYAAVRLKNMAAGNYYIGFRAYGGMQALLIDDVRIDDAAEVAVTALAVSNNEPAYDPEPATVNLTLHNYGNQDVTDAKVTYTLYTYTAANPTPEAIDMVEETIAAPVPAGGELNYSFDKKITYSREGSYIVTATLTLPSTADADKKNNQYQCSASQRLMTSHVPVLWTMEDRDQSAGFTFDEKDSWKIGAVNPYDGTRSLYHRNDKLYDAGDFVVLNRVHLTPGKYQLSFFWQTTRGMEGDEYKQSFDVLLGQKPDLASMSTVLMSVQNRTAADKKHRKEMVDLVIDREDNYFIGFNLVKGSPLGNIMIDNVRIEVPEAKYDMTGRQSVYEADFAARSEEWQHYHPLQITAQQWTTETDEALGLSYMQTVEFTSYGTHYAASYLQAPAMKLRGGCTYTISFYPEILGVAQTGKALKGNEAIVLYESARDLPDDFKEIGRATKGSDGACTVTFTPEESGLRYLSFLPYCEEDAAFRIHSFKVEMTAAPEDGDWEEIGTCEFTDPVFSALDFTPQTMSDVVMEKNTQVENRYRLVNPYAQLVLPAGKAGEYSYDAVRATPIVFDIIDNKYAYVHPFNTGWSVNTATEKGEITCFMQADNLLATDLTMEQVIALAPGCLATVDYDRITAPATFDFHGYTPEPPVFLVKLSETQGTYAANREGKFMITLPEAARPDSDTGWENVGTAVLTDVFVSGCYDGMAHQELECELQRSEENKDVYRLVNPYASWSNPDDQAFTFSNDRPRYMVIHTEKAPYIWFEEFVTGVKSSTGGMITGQCYAGDFVSALGADKAVTNATEAFGRMENYVFTFPVIEFTYQGRNLPTVFTRYADNPQSLTRCNNDNAFKVVFKLAEEGVAEIVADGEVEYYSLQGLRLSEPTPGIPVIVRKGGKSFKVIVR